MQVNRNSFHARIYRWWYRSKYHYEPSAWTNLCPYMRAVMFWSWMRFLFIGGKIPFFFGKRIPVPALAWGLIAFEVPRWLGCFSYNAKMGLYFFYFIVALAILGMVLWACLSWTVRTLFKRTIRIPGVSEKLEKFGDGAGEFVDLVGEYSRSFHDRICPEIDFYTPQPKEETTPEVLGQ